MGRFLIHFKTIKGKERESNLKKKVVFLLIKQKNKKQVASQKLSQEGREIEKMPSCDFIVGFSSQQKINMRGELRSGLRRTLEAQISFRGIKQRNSASTPLLILPQARNQFAAHFCYRKTLTSINENTLLLGDVS